MLKLRSNIIAISCILGLIMVAALLLETRAVSAFAQPNQQAAYDRVSFTDSQPPAPTVAEQTLPGIPGTDAEPAIDQAWIFAIVSFTAIFVTAGLAIIRWGKT